MEKYLAGEQLSEQEFLFIPLKADSIIYYNSHNNKRVASSLPPIYDRQLGWETKITVIDDSVLLLNSGVNGFYRFQINRQTGSIQAGNEKYLPAYHITCLFTDKNKRLWVGTSRGLLKQELTSPPVSAFPFTHPLP